MARPGPSFAAVAVLAMLLALASCARQTAGDPLLNAWAEACADGGSPSSASLSRFHDIAQDYASSPVFVLMAQDLPEIEAVMEGVVALSAGGPQGSKEKLESLLLDYGRLSSLSSERSSHVIILILLLLSLFSLLLILFSILFLRQQRYLAEMRRKSELERAVSVATIRMQEDERGRIYKELHDTIAQDSRSALFALQSLSRRVEGDPAAMELCGKIERLEGSNIENVRSVIRNIIPPDLLGDFRTVLAEWASNVSHASAGGAECRLLVADGVDFAPLVPDRRLHLFRIMQEAVSNAARHSGADEISVMFRTGAMPDGSPSLVLIVSDDGRGFVPLDLPSRQSDGEGHFGIRGMRSRAEILGGVFRIRAAPGEGCEVFVEVPVRIPV